MSIVKKISTALYSPLILQYRYNGNIAVVELPRQAWNVEVPFSNEEAFNCFLEASKYYVDKGLLLYSEVKNERDIENTAKKEKDKELKKVSSKADDSFAEIKDFAQLKRGGVDLVVEKSEPNK